MPTLEERVATLEEKVATLHVQLNPPPLESEISEDEKLVMGPQIRNMLRREGIVNWSELDRMTERDLCIIKNMGEGSVEKVLVWVKLKRARMV